MKSYTLKKQDRLTRRSQIESLFRDGAVFHTGPLKVIYRFEKDTESPVKVLVSAPSRKFRKAVLRNHLKRLMREAYRMNRSILKTDKLNSTLSLHIGIIYLGDKQDISQDEITSALISALNRIDALIPDQNPDLQGSVDPYQ